MAVDAMGGCEEGINGKGFGVTNIEALVEHRSKLVAMKAAMYSSKAGAWHASSLNADIEACDKLIQQALANEKPLRCGCHLRGVNLRTKRF